MTHNVDAFTFDLRVQLRNVVQQEFSNLVRGEIEIKYSVDKIFGFLSAKVKRVGHQASVDFLRLSVASKEGADEKTKSPSGTINQKGVELSHDAQGFDWPKNTIKALSDIYRQNSPYAIFNLMYSVFDKERQSPIPELQENFCCTLFFKCDENNELYLLPPFNGYWWEQIETNEVGYHYKRTENNYRCIVTRCSSSTETCLDDTSEAFVPVPDKNYWTLMRAFELRSQYSMKMDYTLMMPFLTKRSDRQNTPDNVHDSICFQHPDTYLSRYFPAHVPISMVQGICVGLLPKNVCNKLLSCLDPKTSMLTNKKYGTEKFFVDLVIAEIVYLVRKLSPGYRTDACGEDYGTRIPKNMQGNLFNGGDCEDFAQDIVRVVNTIVQTYNESHRELNRLIESMHQPLLHFCKLNILNQAWKIHIARGVLHQGEKIENHTFAVVMHVGAGVNKNALTKPNSATLSIVETTKSQVVFPDEFSRLHEIKQKIIAQTLQGDICMTLEREAKKIYPYVLIIDSFLVFEIFIDGGDKKFSFHHGAECYFEYSELIKIEPGSTCVSAQKKIEQRVESSANNEDVRLLLLIESLDFFSNIDFFLEHAKIKPKIQTSTTEIIQTSTEMLHYHKNVKELLDKYVKPLFDERNERNVQKIDSLANFGHSACNIKTALIRFNLFQQCYFCPDTKLLWTGQIPRLYMEYLKEILETFRMYTSSIEYKLAEADSDNFKMIFCDKCGENGSCSVVKQLIHKLTDFHSYTNWMLKDSDGDTVRNELSSIINELSIGKYEDIDNASASHLYHRIYSLLSDICFYIRRNLK